MATRISMTVLLCVGLAFACPMDQVLAQQLSNPWDPFAAKANTPAKTKKNNNKPAHNSSSSNRYDEPGYSSPNDPGAPTRLQANNRQPLRPMNGLPPNDPQAPVGQNNQHQPYSDQPYAGFENQNPSTSPATTVERSELKPVISTDGSGLPYELWRGLNLEGVEKLLAALDIPPRSQALHALWVKLITSQAALSGNPETDRKFAALRMQALYRSGLKDPSTNTDSSNIDNSDPLGILLLARSDIVFGHADRGCRNVRQIDVNAIPDALKSDAILLFGYCAALTQNSAATQLAAELAHEHASNNTAAISALDAVANGTTAKLPSKGSITGLTYRILEIAKQKPGLDTIKRAEPALLVALTNDTKLDPVTRLHAAEAATRINAIKPAALADIYRLAAGQNQQSNQPTSNWAVPPANASTNQDPLTRAALFSRLENEFTPFKKARLTRTFLDHARKAGLYLPSLQMVHATTDSLRPVPEISWFSETAIEIALAANDPQRARSWANLNARLDQRSTGNLDHWLALLDIADSDQTTPRGANLQSVEDMALNGRFSSQQLHRLATVLDALDYHVPIPLWQAASNTPQPKGGHLPETGVLTRLQDAAKNHEFGRTILLAMQALGPNGAEGAHMISLGDSIRALKRAGLEHDARRLGFEALFASWPRVTSR